MNQNSKILSAGLLLIALSGCTKGSINTTQSIATGVDVDKIGNRQTVTPNANSSDEVNARITLNKAEIFGKEFLYGADLQYSSIYDKDYDLYSQSQALGHVPAIFRKSGNELQLIADQRRLYPSDVNHPEQLISRFKILYETSTTITVSHADSSAFLISMVDSKAHVAKDHWARSFEFVEKGNYILQETSVVLQDGTVAEMMESIMPQETMAVSKTFEKFEMDPEDAVGASEGPAARYRMLNGEAIFGGEDKLSFAQHFDINDAQTSQEITIDWYVTPNIKDEHLPVVQQAVEGWNRYFRNFAGIKRDVVLFKGKMPAGMKLGDPRFNIINWDSRLVAGAAYESQATDPFTGKQSHSLIYMPVAWFQIGMDYWKNGQYSDEVPAPKAGKSVGNSKFKLSCARELSGAAAALNSGRMSQKEAEAFSIQLMKQTLFHEVGHALGLAHNFKGSLSYDRKDPKSFSTSIMDYNDYEIERAAFTDPNTADGPQLEYDRQALSAIYNQMADVKANDPVLPVCNDAEADTEESGSVDPLCLRYDIEKDPTISIETSLNRVNLDKLDGDVTLAEALDRVAADVLTVDALAKVKSEADAKLLAKKYKDALKGAMNFYFIGSKASISKTVRTNLRSLYVFADDVLPAGFDEMAMRERAFKGVQSVVDLRELSAPVKKKLMELSVNLTATIAKTGFGSTIAADAVVKMGEEFEKDASKGLIKLRAQVVGALLREESLPLYFGNGKDFEIAMITVLYETIRILKNSQVITAVEIAAAKALVTYKGRPQVDAMLSGAKEVAEFMVTIARNNKDREKALALKAALER